MIFLLGFLTGAILETIGLIIYIHINDKKHQ